MVSNMISDLLRNIPDCEIKNMVITNPLLLLQILPDLLGLGHDECTYKFHFHLSLHLLSSVLLN